MNFVMMSPISPSTLCSMNLFYPVQFDYCIIPITPGCMNSLCHIHYNYNINNRRRGRRVSPMLAYKRSKYNLGSLFSLRHQFLHNCPTFVRLQKKIPQHFERINLWDYFRIYVITLQENLVFLTGRIFQKVLQMSPCSSWQKCHFGQVDLDPTILTK